MARPTSTRLHGLSVSVIILLLIALLFMTPAIQAHGDDMDEDRDPSEEAEERRRKQQFMLVAHAVIASIVVWITLPVSLALVAGKKIELHRNVASVNTLMLCFVGLIAMLGFAEGNSWHSIIAFICLGAWVAQSGYGWIRHYYFRTKMPIKPHRAFGIILFGFTMLTWSSGVLHVMGSCSSPSQVQMCNAHFYLGALFVIVGLVNGYYNPEFAAKVEMCLIAFGGISELVGEGVVDSILNAIDPETFKWDGMAKMYHLTTASIWVLCAFIGWIFAVRRPSTLKRGLALTLGSFFHLTLMIVHGGEANARTNAAHVVHELALVPVLIARPISTLPVITSYMLIVSGFAFIMAADPITDDVGDSVAPFVYCLMIITFASIFHVVHRLIKTKILRKEPSETMLERTGFAQPVYCVLNCFGRLCCCCPSINTEVDDLSKVSAATKYQHLETQSNPGEEETKLQEMDEDVTSAPPV